MVRDHGTGAEGLRPLETNLAQEVLRLEGKVATAGLVLSALCLVPSLYAAVAISARLGAALGALAALLVGWFALVRRLVAHGVAPRVLQLLCPLVEMSVPTAVLLVDATQRGATYAVAMSVPLQLYGLLAALQVIRLRRLMPLVAAAFGAAQYLALYLLYLRPRVPTALLAAPEYDLPIASLKAAVVVLAGVAATLVGIALRGAVTRAARKSRASDLFGKYRIQGLVAEGGMGAVHRALYCPEGGFERPVALKRIHPHLAKDEVLVAAFRREAALSSRLVHANIVQVIDFGRVDDTYFLAMEFVDGLTLRDLLRRCAAAQAPVPERVLIHIGAGILEGLHFAGAEARDSEGRLLAVVHRDLSPPNVLLGRSGEVRVSDFGIARALGEGGQLHTTTVAGKAAYMSPEQARGEPIDVRTDLFATGIILWELATLTRLFHRGHDAATLLAVLNDEAPPPGSIRPDAARLDPFFAKALAKRPQDRFQTAREMKAALDAFAEGRLPSQDELRDYLARLPPAPVKAA